MSALPKGIVVTEDEYGLVADGLMALAEQARKAGRTDLYGRLKRFIVRLKQSVHAGDGIAPEILEKIAQPVETAFAARDFSAAHDALVNMIATVVRSDPDPGRQIALKLAPIFVEVAASGALAQQQQIAAVALRLFAERLDTEKAQWEQHGWSKPEATLVYIRELAEFCARDLESGHDPFEFQNDPKEN